MSTISEWQRELAGRCAGRRIAYVCADPGIGVFGTKGASVHAQAVIRTLRQAGAQVDVFAVKAGGQPPPDLADLPVHLLPTRADAHEPEQRERQLLAADAGTAAVLDGVLLDGAGPFDLYYERYSLFSAGGARWAARQHIPVIVEVNAPLIDEHDQHRGLVHKIEAAASLRRLMGAADLAVCVSEPVRHWVTSRVRGTHAVVVPNGADVHRVRPRRDVTDTHAKPARAGQDRSTPATTVGFVGTLKPWHGVEVLLDAVAPLLRPRGPQPPAARLLVVGDGPLAEQIDRRIEALGVGAQVERTGAVDPSRIPEFLRRMDIGVAPYPADAGTYFSPLKVLEYLAAGLPVVASDVGQLPTMISHARTGLLVPPSDAAALRDAIATLLADPARRSRMGRAARTAAESTHSWEQTVVRTLRALPTGLPAPVGAA